MKRTPLRRGKPLARGKPLGRGKGNPIPAVSRESVAVRSGGVCELGTPVCELRATEVHHLAGRVGEGAHDPSNLRATCRACHIYVGDHPAESYERGWMARRNGR